MPWHTEPAKSGMVYVVDDKGKRYSDKPMQKWRAKKQMAALYASEPQKKEVSLDKQIQSVVTAIVQKLNPPMPAYPDTTNMYTVFWVKEVYSSYAVVCSGDNTYKIDYTMNADGMINLGDPIEVEMTWKPVGKAIATFEKKPKTPREKGFFTIKQADGSYRWITISSSAFRDRDGEIVSQKSLEDDIARCDAIAEYGPLRWWHYGTWEYPDGPESWQTWKAADGLDLGTCDFNMLHGKMLIESGTYKDAKIAEAIASMDGDLEVSICFSHPMDEPGTAKEYQNIHRIERSLLPAGMASNLLTRVYNSKGEPDMLKAKEKLAALVAIVKGQPELVTKILADAEAVQKAAEEAGLEFKEVSEMLEEKATEGVVDAAVDTPADAPTDAPTDTPVDEVAEDVIGDMSRMDLAMFVQEVIKQSTPNPDVAVVAKQAAQEQQVEDALVALRASGERLNVAEKTIKELQQSLLELTDSRPVGIKQMQNLRPTQKAENVTQVAPTGPQMDPAFLKLVQGGK